MHTAQEAENLRIEHAWISQCRRSAIVVTVAWILWVVLVQVLLTDKFPSSWFVQHDDSGEAAGW
jgi:hypothetical protein